jgi:hypothetical protein
MSPFGQVRNRAAEPESLLNQSCSKPRFRGSSIRLTDDFIRNQRAPRGRRTHSRLRLRSHTLQSAHSQAPVVPESSRGVSKHSSHSAIAPTATTNPVEIAPTSPAPRKLITKPVQIVTGTISGSHRLSDR